MWKANACPQCGRDVFRYQNINGTWYERCFRCGYHAKLESMIEIEHLMNDDCHRQAEEGNLISRNNKRRCSDDYDTLGAVQGDDELEECYGQAV